MGTMKRALAWALLILCVASMAGTPTLANPSVPGVEYRMLAYQLIGNSVGTPFTRLYSTALMHGVAFNTGVPIRVIAPDRATIARDIDALAQVADDDDVSYLFLTGAAQLRGDGAILTLAGDTEIALNDLAQLLQSVRGLKCVTLDVLLADGAPEAWNEQAKAAFSAPECQMLSACTLGESVFNTVAPRVTWHLLTGMGHNKWNDETDQFTSSKMPADKNKDRMVSMRELGNYVISKSKKLPASTFSLAMTAVDASPIMFARRGVRKIVMRPQQTPFYSYQPYASAVLDVEPVNADIARLKISGANRKVLQDCTANLGLARGRIVGMGKSKLQVKSLDYPYPKATTTLQVTPVKGERVSIVRDNQEINDTTITLNRYSSFAVSGSVIPSNAYEQSVKWTSSNKKAVVLEPEGDIYWVASVGFGTSVITAKTKDGTTGSFTVHSPVIEPSRITQYDDITLTEGFSLDRGGRCSPNGCYGSVLYKSSNKKIVSVNAKGVITTKKPGVAQITLYCKEKPSVSSTYTVTVRENAREWDAPNPDAMGEGLQFAPCRLWVANKQLIAQMYVINHTDAPITRLDGHWYLSLRNNRSEGNYKVYTNSFHDLKVSSEIKPGEMGVFTYKFSKKSAIYYSNGQVDKLGNMDIPVLLWEPSMSDSYYR